MKRAVVSGTGFVLWIFLWLVKQSDLTWVTCNANRAILINMYGKRQSDFIRVDSVAATSIVTHNH